MRLPFTPLALLALGCSPTASPPVYTMADAGSYDAPAAYANDGTGDGQTTITPDVPDAGDGGEGSRCVDPSRGVGMVCNGACDFVTCGRCGNVCPQAYSCCDDGTSRLPYCCITP